MSYILGIMLGVFCIAFSLHLLDQSYLTYVDDVAILMVIGGTFAVAIVALPWHNLGELMRSVAGMLFGRSPHHQEVVFEGLRFVQERTYDRNQSRIKNTIAGELLNDGAEMIALNFSVNDIKSILDERLHHYMARKKDAAGYFLKLAKYPPAFGLVGTVFGLINLMRSLTDGMTPAETGVKMSLALVATLYGLIVSNFIIFPIGEAITKRNNLEKFHAELILQAVLLASENISLLKSQELLNSYVPRQQRVDMIRSVIEQASA